MELFKLQMRPIRLISRIGYIGLIGLIGFIDLIGLISPIHNVAQAAPQYAIQVFGPDGKYLPDLKLDVTETANSLTFAFPKKNSFHPGRYTVRVFIVRNGVVYVSESDFSWGVIALNFNKTVYSLKNGDEATIGFSVLDDRGHTICDAEAAITISLPGGVAAFSTKNGSIQKSPDCAPTSITNTPDYYATFKPEKAGAYNVTLTATTVNGTRTTSDSFTAENEPQWNVERSGPTRIYPPADYRMEIKIGPIGPAETAGWSGTITETLPAGFQILRQGIDGAEVKNSNSVATTTGDNSIFGTIENFINSINPVSSVNSTTPAKDTQEINWNVSWKGGEGHALDYEFRAPDVSPEFYLLGPLAATPIGHIGLISPIESRQWQIAADATPNTVVFVSSTASTTWTVPSDWNNSSNSIEVIGAGGAGATGGANVVPGGGGGGGGAYAKISNWSTSTTGGLVAIEVGTGATNATGTATLFGNNTVTTTCANTNSFVCAAGGNRVASTSAGSAGGTAANSSGTVRNAGGAGGNGGTTVKGLGGGGGGGAGGQGGTGGAGASSTLAVAPGGGGGGGGNSGGSIASGTVSSAGGKGGNNSAGAGGGAGGSGGATCTNGTDGSSGGGGGGGGGTSGTATPCTGGVGSTGTEWTESSDSQIAGSGGGGGGGGGNTRTSGTTNPGGAGGTAGIYGGGGGGGGSCGDGTCLGGVGLAGANGIIIITYTPLTTTLNQTSTRWRNNDGSETTAGWQAAENATGTATSTANVYRLRLEIVNSGNSTTTPKFQLQYQMNATSAGLWTTVPTTSTLVSQLFLIASSTQFTDGASTTLPQLTAYASASSSGQIKQSSSTTGYIVMAGDTYTEVEYAIRLAPADTYANNGTYYFQVQKPPSTLLDSYKRYPALTISLPFPPRRTIVNSPMAQTTTTDSNIAFWMTGVASTTPTYVQYKQIIYDNEACTNAVQTNDQSVSQTGWSGQNASTTGGSSAYNVGTATGTTGILTLSSLATGMYYWGAQATDPDGSGQWSVDPTTRVDNNWNGTQFLPANAITEHSSVAYNGYVYVIGGKDNLLAATATVRFAQIKSNGTLGAWTNTQSLPVGTDDHASAVYNGYVYVIGGYTGAAIPTATVRFAQIKSNGTLGAWTNTQSLPTGTVDHASFAYNGYLYEIGGYVDGPGVTSTVRYAQINATGSLGSWINTWALRSGVLWHSAAVYNDYVYVIGGVDIVFTATSAVSYAHIQSSGTLGAWMDTQRPLPTNTHNHSSFANNGYLYVAGGCGVNGSCVDGTSTVLYSAINATGSLGSWTLTNSMPTGTSWKSSVVSNGYAYLIGGQSTGAAVTGSVYYSRINVQGDTADEGWVNDAPLPSSTYNQSSVVYNGYAYVAGGISGSSATATVLYSSINSNGTITNWSRTTALPAGTYYHSSVAYNGYLYEIAGNDATFNPTSTVRYAQIQSNGTLEAQWHEAAVLRGAVYSHSSVAYEGYMYVIGGSGGGAGLTSTVLYGPIQSNGTISNWSSTTALPTSTYDHSSVAYNGYVYVIGGGISDGTVTSTVLYAPINATGSLGSWVNTTALPTSTFRGTSILYNGYVYLLGGETSDLRPTSTVSYSKIQSDGSLSSWINAASMPTGTYAHSSFVYDGYLYNIGGRNVTNGAATATVTSIGLYTSCTLFNVSHNYAPTVSNVQLQSGGPIILSPNATATVTVGYTVQDNNDCTEVFTSGTSASGNTTSTAFRLGQASVCATTTPATDNRYCYKPVSSVNNCTAGNFSAHATDTFEFYYFADSTNDPSSTYPNDHWEAYAFAMDSSGATSSATSSNAEVNVMYGIEVSPATSTYGTLYTGTNTSSTNQVHYAQNAGNVTTTLSLFGTAFTSGSNFIATSSQHYATSSFTFGGSEQLLQGTSTNVVGFNAIPKHTDTGPIVMSWKNTSALPSTLDLHSAVTYNGYIYTTGGVSSNAVYYAPITSTGSVGVWRTNPNSLPGQLYSHSAVAYNGYIYTTGGNDSVAATSTVFYAQINTSSTGSWYTNPYSLSTSTTNHSAVVYGGYIYVIGGQNAATAVTSTIFYAQINGSSTGQWLTNPNSLPGPLLSHSAVAYNGYVYVTGGVGGGGSSVTSSVFYAQINTSSTGPWYTNPYSLPTSTYDHSAVAYNGYIYVMGGRVSGGAVTSTIYYTQINTSSTGPWLTNPNSLPSALARYSSVVYNGYIYTTGGVDVSFSSTSTVLYTSLDNRPIYWGAEAPRGAAGGNYQSTVTYTAQWSQ